jgi:DNA-binding transcriptional LysR family regulator
MDIELRHLRRIRMLAAQRNFARAAKALNISQPVLSRSIQALESRLGARLFERGSNAVELTDAGRLLLEHGNRVIERADELSRTVTRLRSLGRSELVIGAGPYAAAMIVPTALARLANEQPEVRIRVVTHDWTDLIEMVRRGALQFAVLETSTVREDPLFVVEQMEKHSGYFVARPGHPILKAPHITINDVAAYPIGFSGHVPTRALDSLVAQRLGGAFRGPTFTCASLDVLKRIAAESDTIVPLPLSLVRDDVVHGALVIVARTPDWLRLEYGIVRLASMSLTSTAKELISHLKDVEREVAAIDAQPARVAVAVAPRRTRGANGAAARASEVRTGDDRAAFRGRRGGVAPSKRHVS